MIIATLKEDFMHEHMDGEEFVVFEKGQTVYWDEEADGWYSKMFPQQFWYIDDEILDIDYGDTGGSRGYSEASGVWW